jgi:hypothetical protein
MPTTAAITITEGEWALCAAGQADGHLWMLLEPEVSVIEALTLIARSTREAALIGATPDDETIAVLDGLNTTDHPTTNP